MTFAKVFANEIAAAEIEKDNPMFPVGSLIVREKLLKADDSQPELITAMLKREKGFNKKTGDWEYFVVNSDVSKVQEREAVGSCSKCHQSAQQSDFVFRQFLK